MRTTLAFLVSLAVAHTSWSGVSLNADGFHDVTASADSRTLYVSSTGSDATGDGTSAHPWATIAYAYSHLVNGVEMGVRDGYPDQILLKRGDTFTAPSLGWGKSGRGATEPMLLGAYGTGDRPIVLGTDGGAIIFQGANPRFIFVQSVEFAPNAGSNIGNGIYRIGNCDTITLEDVYIHGFQFNLQFQENQSTDNLNSITLYRCVVADSSPGLGYGSGMLAGHCNDLVIDQCAFIGNGWANGSGTRSMFNHNFYLYGHCNRVTIRDTIVANGSYLGISCNSNYGSLLNNLIVGNCVGINARTQNTLVEGNIVTECEYTNALDGGANDADSCGINMAAAMPETAAFNQYGPLTVRNNIVMGPCVPLSFNSPWYSKPAIKFHDRDLWDSRESRVLTGNIVYNWEGPCVLVENRGDVIPSQVSGNTFWANNGAYGARPIFDFQQSSNPTQFSFSGNKYYRSDAGGTWFSNNGAARTAAQWVANWSESGATTTSPVFSDPTRTVGTYAASVGLTGTRAAFLAAARANRRGSWNSNYTASAATAYIRAGFGGTVSNIAPVANAGPTQNLTDTTYAGSVAFTLNGSGSTDSDGTISTYSWSCLVGDSLNTASGVSAAFTLPLGSHTVHLTVTDNGGATGSATTTINVRPGAARAPTSTVGSGSVTLGCTAGETGVDGYVWDYGTTTAYGTTVSSASNSKAIGSLNNGTVYHWRVAYSAGGILGPWSSDQTFTPVGVSNSAPTANAGTDQTVADSNLDGFVTFTLDGSGSTDSDGTIATYSWSCLVGDTYTTATGVHGTMILPLGTYTATLVVTDNGGATSVADTVVLNSKPGTPIGLAATPVVNGAHFACTPYMAATTYSWKWGTTSSYGTTVTTSTPYYDLGGRTPGTAIHWTVAAVAGGLTSDYASDQTVTPISSNTPPVVSAGPTQRVTCARGATSKAVTMAGTATDDGTVAYVRWSECGITLKESPTNGNVATVLTIPITLRIGNHALTLMARDDSGLETSRTVTINVLPYPNSGWGWWRGWYRPRRRKGNTHGR